MKITDIKVIPVQAPGRTLVPVLVHTDEGTTGLGEAGLQRRWHAIAGAVEHMKPWLIGQDPRRIEYLWQRMFRGGFYPGDRLIGSAISAIDTALWDIRGKIEGKKVAELLASPDRKPLDKVRLYASGGVNYDWEDRPESVVDEALDYISRGFTAFKMRIGTEWSWAGVTAGRFIELLRQVTEAVAGRMDLMLDGNQRLTEEQALQIARAMDEMDWTWFEEPIPQKDIAGYARLNKAVSMPITGGEQYTTVEQYIPYMEQKAYEIVQADCGWCGLTVGMEITRYAHEFGVPHCPHSWHNGLMGMANGHLVAAQPDPRVLELCMFQGPLQWEILKEKPAMIDGYLILPDKPGLGVELADDLEKRFPYIEGSWAESVKR